MEHSFLRSGSLLFFALCGLLCLRTASVVAQACPGEVMNITQTTYSPNSTFSTWTVPSGGPYKLHITTKGGRGGSRLIDNKFGGNGATVIGDFIVAGGQVLEAKAGSTGFDNPNQVGNCGGGGGGGFTGGNSNGNDSGSGGSSLNLGFNQNNSTGNNNGGGQVIIECLGTAAFTASILTATTCGATLDLTGDAATSLGQVEYAVVSGSSFGGNPAFTLAPSDPFTTSSTAAGTFTLRIRLKYNPSVFADYTYTVTGTPGLWMGCVSTDWNTAGNWSDGNVPTATDDVYIPNMANDPVISAAAVAKTVHVQAGAQLSIGTTGSLEINGFILGEGGQTTAFFIQGTVSNDGTLNIGTVSSVGKIGLTIGLNGTLNNNANGQIFINRSFDTGLAAYGNMTNAGYVEIGGSQSVGDFGLFAYRAVTNTVSGQISIDRASKYAIYIYLLGSSTASFTNFGSITIGASGNVGQYAVLNISSKVNNSGCSALINILSNSVISMIGGVSNFTNSGTIIENASDNSNITNNSGIVQNLNGGTFTIANNAGGLVAEPISGSCNISPALTLGATAGFDIATQWFLDENLTQAAGTYNPATNTFNATNLPSGVPTTVYFQVTDNANNCTRTVSTKITATGTAEVCDGLDNDCDGVIDDGVASSGAPCGQSGLNYGPNSQCRMGVTTCVNGVTICVGGVGPSAETCDGIDNDCDGTVDEDAGNQYFADADGDGYGNPAISQTACAQPSNYVSNNSDCNDAAANINPAATEIVADAIDQNCDNQELCYHDADNDGYTTANPSTIPSADLDCTDDNEETAIDSPTDCNDGNAAIKPTATETCSNGTDDDCDGLTDEGCGTPVQFCNAVDNLTAIINGLPEPPADATVKFWLTTSLEYAKMFFQMGFEDWALAMLGPSLEYESFRYWIFYFNSANPQKLTDAQKNFLDAVALDLIAAIEDGTATCGGTRPGEGGVTDVIEHEQTVSEVKMLVSPNPTAGPLTVQFFDFEKSAAGALQIFDAAGRLAYRQTLEPGTTRLEIDLSENGLANGFYTLRVRVGERVLTRKVSVLR